MNNFRGGTREGQYFWQTTTPQIFYFDFLNYLSYASENPRSDEEFYSGSEFRERGSQNSIVNKPKYVNEHSNVAGEAALGLAGVAGESIFRYKRNFH